MRLFLILLFAVSSLFAGTKESFDALVKRIQKEPVDLAFNLEIFWSVREKTEKKKGTLAMKGNNCFDLALGGSRWIANGTTLWQYNVAQKQLVIRKFSEMDQSMQPSQMFERFTGKPFKVIKANGGEILRWEGKDKEYSRIDVKLSADGKKFNSILFVDTEQNESRYIFTKMAFLKSIDPKRFNFVKPAGVEVMDER